jgi:hypothetical protein
LIHTFLPRRATVKQDLQQWETLIGTLVVNVTTADSSEAMREASLEALGYICQDLAQAVMERSTNQILTAIVHGMRDEEKSVHVRLAATNALLNSLEFARANFENEVFLEMKINFFLNLLKNEEKLNTVFLPFSLHFVLQI